MNLGWDSRIINYVCMLVIKSSRKPKDLVKTSSLRVRTTIAIVSVPKMRNI